MSVERCRFMVLVLLTAFLCTVFGCAVLPPSATPFPTPLVIPQVLGLPQSQSPMATTPPARPTAPLELPPSSKDLWDREIPLPPDAWFDMVGIWNSQEETAYGDVYTEVILERTGTYSMQARWRDLLTYEVGTYYVGDGFIHFILDNYEPKIYKGQAMSRPLSWTAWYTIVDADTMVWEERILGSRWEVHRQ